MCNLSPAPSSPPPFSPSPLPGTPTKPGDPVGKWPMDLKISINFMGLKVIRYFIIPYRCIPITDVTHPCVHYVIIYRTGSLIHCWLTPTLSPSSPFKFAFWVRDLQMPCVTAVAGVTTSNKNNEDKNCADKNSKENDTPKTKFNCIALFCSVTDLMCEVRCQD